MIVTPETFTAFKSKISRFELVGLPEGTTDVRLIFSRENCPLKTLDTTVQMCKNYGLIVLDFSTIQLPPGSLYQVELGTPKGDYLETLITFNLFLSDVL